MKKEHGKYIKRFGVWIAINEALVADYDGDLIVRFDNGEIRRYDEDYPFAESTHILCLPPIS